MDASTAFVLTLLFTYASSQCTVHYTDYTQNDDGKLAALIHQRLNCGDDRVALKRFAMETRHWTTTSRKWFRTRTKNHYEIRYRYECCPLPLPPGNSAIPYYCGFGKEIANTFTPDGSGNAVFLERQPVQCTSRGILNDFWMEKNPPRNNSIRYNYYCCNVRPNYRMQCYAGSTPRFTDDGDGKVYHLKEQDVRCLSRYFISYFRLIRNAAGNQWRYNYRCCRVYYDWSLK